MLKIALFLLVLASASASLEADWASFKKKYQREYKNEMEDLRRRDIYAANIKKIKEHNELYAQGLSSYYMGENQFSDWTTEEFLRRRTSLIYKTDSIKSHSATIEVSKLPKSVDWRKEGYVTPVQDQGDCGSSYAFASMAALEGQHFKATKKLIKLSESQIVDCSSYYGNYGCEGGRMYATYDYIQHKGGVESASTYPYVDQAQKCKFNKTNVVATDTGYVWLKDQTEASLQNATANVGPIAVGMTTTNAFQSYKGGVFDDPNCYGKQLDHAVAVVGYGTEKGKDYWLVKNSWGTSWGEEGYVKMVRNKKDQCGIAVTDVYPTI